MATPYTPQRSTHTANDVITEVRRLLGDESGTLFSPDDVLAWVNAGQREIAQQLDLMGKATIDLVAGQAEYVFDEVVMKHIRDIQSVVVDGDRLEPVSFQSAQTRWMSPGGRDFPEPGNPRYWYQFNHTITLVPAPDTDVDDGLMVFFARQPLALTASSSELDVPDTHFNALVNYALSRGYMLTQEETLAATAISDARKSIQAQQGLERRAQINTYPTVTADEDLF